MPDKGALTPLDPARMLRFAEIAMSIWTTCAAIVQTYIANPSKRGHPSQSSTGRDARWTATAWRWPMRPKRSTTPEGEVLRAAYGSTLPRMRDIETIDAELRLLLAIRRMVREEEGRPTENRADR
jgi:hypothetical protein